MPAASLAESPAEPAARSKSPRDLQHRAHQHHLDKKQANVSPFQAAISAVATKTAIHSYQGVSGP
eukprot:scaffold439541_cov41-Prasinocladus_malaysianus.AAC.1